MLSVPLIKAAAQIVGGLGVSKIVHQVVQNNTTVVTLTDTILIRAGSLVLGSIAVDHATTHVAEMVDEIVNNFEIRRTSRTNGV